ncbi:unnamed protein product [Spodoptera littoralis]|uniref:Uncharacterized protein n=1 Tax=Spodoptera littoralis TaxID=7109 RepID=A0A9P0I5W6_SPOLI|nr:unnamed protein product [Spodoptera littoralis]CAH1640487.1 unnamed protein product [Spodoptera littoralis]
MALLCAGCLQKIAKTQQFLSCPLCHENYDLECANITPQKFKLMSKAQKTLWNCQSCRCKTPKSDNINTPIRPQHFPSSSVNKPSTEPMRQNTVSSNKSDADNFDDESIVDNTQTPNENLKNYNISLQILDKMLNDRITSLKNYFANDIKRIISEEISKFMLGLNSETMESTKTHDPLQENTSIIISEINSKICTLERENKKLKTELLELKNVCKLPNIENKIYETKLNDTGTTTRKLSYMV